MYVAMSPAIRRRQDRRWELDSAKAGVPTWKVSGLKDRRSGRNRGEDSLAAVSSFLSFSTAAMHGSPSPRGGPARRGRSPRTNADSPAPPALPPDFSIRSPATFTSCLTIAVEGAIPIERSEPAQAASDAAPSDSNSRRAPRKSKTDALAALHSHAQSNAGEEALADSMYEDGGIRIQLRDGPPLPVPSTLDLSSVKTSNTRPSGPKSAPRPFGLTDCPTFHPTPEEFKDPMAYIASISDTGKKYGVCKIVPPAGWNMPFVTDTEVRTCVCLGGCVAPAVAPVASDTRSFLTQRLQRFRFKTRLQRLNSIEASSRAKVNFLEQLYRFHKQQGNPRVSVPTINHKPLDLWLLRKEVHKLGGFDTVGTSVSFRDILTVGLTVIVRSFFLRLISVVGVLSDVDTGDARQEVGRFGTATGLYGHPWACDADAQLVQPGDPPLRAVL